MFFLDDKLCHQVGVEVRLEAEEPAVIPNIKLEQDLGYNDNYDASMQSGTHSYDEDGYLHSTEKDVVNAKVSQVCAGLVLIC